MKTLDEILEDVENASASLNILDRSGANGDRAVGLVVDAARAYERAAKWCRKIAVAAEQRLQADGVRVAPKKVTSKAVKRVKSRGR